MKNDKPVSTFTIMGRMFAFVGWVWFSCMWGLKLSGATIYATTRQSIIQTVNPVWDEAFKKATQEKGTGFVVKIQGIQKW